jgi:hypothetical protein
MKKNSFISAAFICILFLFEVTSAQNAQNSQKIEQNKTISLFNGKNLDGWYTFLKGRGRDTDPKNVFTVNGGMVRIPGEEWGCITTEKEYENYKLVVEFKWGEKTFDPRLDKTRDSGILLHSNGKDGAYSGTWMNSIECQIIEGGTGDFIVVGDKSDNFSITAKVDPGKEKGNYYHPDGKPVTINSGRINWYARDINWVDQLGFRGKQDVENQVGEWNRIECIAVDDKISIFLNGTLVNEAYNVKPRKGKIQIQSEGAEMFVRKVELTPLSQKQLVSIHANNGEGIGPKIKLMPEWDAFGYFTSQDKIEWKEVNVPDNSLYDVYLEWSVSDNDAGKPFVLEIGKNKLEGTVQKSGSWETFRTIKIGTVRLKKGTYSASFSPKEQSFKGGLLDFREIKLIPQSHH